MGTVLSFDAARQGSKTRERPDRNGACEIVIFPGVRIERHDLDLSERLWDVTGSGGYDGVGGKGGSRKRS